MITREMDATPTAKRSKQELLEVVQDNDRACVDRGEAITGLVQAGITQATIAESTHLSTAAISHLKTCFNNLHGGAREMCRHGRMNADACYSLASAHADNRERIYQAAVKIRERKDAQRDVQRIGSKGKQSRPGQITDEDIKDAVHDVKRELASKTLAERGTRGGFQKTLVKRRGSREFTEPTERDGVPNEILAELKSERLKVEQEAEEDEREYFRQIRKEEEGKLKRADTGPKGRSPSSCLEDRPTARSAYFAGTYIDVAAIASASGLSAVHISRTFAGKSKLTLEVARKVSAALSMSVGDFIDTLDKQAALQRGLRKRGLTDVEIGYTISEGWKRGFKPPGL